MSTDKQTAKAVKESFADLMSQHEGDGEISDKRVVKGTIIDIRNDYAIIDVGMKSEGRVPLRELSSRVSQDESKVGDVIDVFVERLEDRHGETVLSVEKARREAVWTDLEKSYNSEELVNGVMFGKVKGGFAVDLNGAVAFLPGSQVDIRPVRDVTPLMNIVQPFKILKMDKLRSNIVVSRRSVLEETRAEARTELVSKLSEGQVVDGIVKNITDYGAFVDLGGVDGLLHVTDISWKRVNHPSDVLNVGDTIKVVVIRFNKATHRISLGMKQLESDPWQGVQERFVVGQKYKGTISNITDYGAFVELGGIEGLIYITELSWTRKNTHPSKIVSLGDEVEVVVLEVDAAKRRMSLGLKQCLPNPWEDFMNQYPAGSTVEGVIKNTTEFGVFIGLSDDIDGMIHLNDLSWDEPGEVAIQKYEKDQKITVKVLDIDPNKERITLGVKQLASDPFDSIKIKKNDIVTCTVKAVSDKALDVELSDGLTGSIKKADLSRDRLLQRTDRFAVGEKVDAKVVSIDSNSRSIQLSIKARELDEEKQALSEYGSSDSGARLGDILGEAINKAKTQ